jgi:hypothetical protein
MMAWTHAAIGAAVGSRASSNEAAFAAGAVSHGIADLIPHRDYDMKVELPFLGTALGLIAWRYGVNSKQFWGAVGGFSPDIENGLFLLGLLPGQVYPTHTKRSWFIGHGEKVKSVIPQIILAAVCIYIAEKSKTS